MIETNKTLEFTTKMQELENLRRTLAEETHKKNEIQEKFEEIKNNTSK